MASGPTVFIAGAHTYLGSRVAAVCQERDFDVVCLAHENQDTSALQAIGVEIVRGSILEPEDWKNTLKRCDWALNLHRHIAFGGPGGRPDSDAAQEKKRTERTLRAINVEGTMNFLDTCINLGVPKVLTLSTLLAIGDHRGEIADERVEHRRHFRSPYEKSMYDALFQTKVRIADGAQIACVLPGPIMGPRADGPFAKLVEDYVRGTFPWAVDGPSSMTFTYIDDLVRGIFLIMERRAPVGLYIFANEPETWNEFFRKLASISGVQPRKGWLRESRLESKVNSAARWGSFSGRPPPIAKQLLPYLVDAQYRFSCEKARAQLGWDYTTMEIWLAEMVEEIKTADQGPATQAAFETFRRSSLPAGY